MPANPATVLLWALIDQWKHPSLRLPYDAAAGDPPLSQTGLVRTTDPYLRSSARPVELVAHGLVEML